MSPSDLAVRPRRTQAQRRQEAELALLEAAMHLFAENGIDGTSLADIGEEAGYSRGLVNHRFGSKEAFVERLAAASQAGFVHDLGKPVPRKEVESLCAVIDTYLDRLAHEAISSRAFFVMWGASFPNGSPLRSIFKADDAYFRDGISAIVRSGQAGGRIPETVDASSFAVAFVGLLRGIGAQYLVDPVGIDLGACRTTTLSLVRGALKVDLPMNGSINPTPERDGDR